MGRYVILAVMTAGLSFAVFSYLGKNRKPVSAAAAEAGNLSAASAAAESKPNGFMGNSGYLLEFPGNYDAFAEMRGRVEMAFFFPKGGQPSVDESKYKELGLVRLEVIETPPTKKKGAEVAAAVKRGVEKSLQERRETYTVKDLALLNGAFLVHITQPNDILQLFVQGEKVIYMFTGGDEALMSSLAGSIRETGAAAPGK